MEVKDLPAPVYALDTNPNPDKKQVAFGLANGNIHIFNYDVETKNEEFEPYNGDVARIAK